MKPSATPHVEVDNEHAAVSSIVAYGARIEVDCMLPLELPVHTAARSRLALKKAPPEILKSAYTENIPFYPAHGREVYLHTDREFTSSEHGQPWCYEARDIVCFYWTGGSENIYYRLEEKGDLELLGFWFIHLVLPLYFTLEDWYDFLHAGAVEVDDKPILFIAPSMGGKSTLTDYFLKQGHTLVSDDKVATFQDNDRFMLTGSHPYHRPYRGHEDLGYRVDDFMTGFKPIHAIYQLVPLDAQSPVEINEIEGYRKFDALMPNYLFMFDYLRPQRLEYLAALLNEIRLFQVEIPWNLKRLDEVHAAIVKHSRQLA